MSFLSNLFVVKIPPSGFVKGESQAAAASNNPAVPVFLTPKTLGSLATGVFFIGIVWKLMKMLLADYHWVTSPWTPFAISLVYGLGVFCASVSDADAKPKSAAGWIAAAIVGVFNSLLLAAAVLGLVKLSS